MWIKSFLEWYRAIHDCLWTDTYYVSTLDCDREAVHLWAGETVSDMLTCEPGLDPQSPHKKAGDDGAHLPSQC